MYKWSKELSEALKEEFGETSEEYLLSLQASDTYHVVEGEPPRKKQFPEALWRKLAFMYEKEPSISCREIVKAKELGKIDDLFEKAKKQMHRHWLYEECDRERWKMYFFYEHSDEP